MGDPNKGTDIENSNINENDDWFIIREAECVDANVNVLNDLFEESNSGSYVSNLIDDDPVEQGNSLAFFNEQVSNDCDRALLDLKRKYLASPEKSVTDLTDLSPRLDAVHISPQRQIKKRLFEDSGIVQDEAANTNENVQVDGVRRHDENQSGSQIVDFLKCSNFKALFLAKFKEIFGVSYNDLTRPFKSNKTCCNNWILALYKVSEDVIESSKIVLKQQCNYVQIIMYDIITLYLVEFKVSKSRDTIQKLFATTFSVDTMQIITDPPRSRSVAAALFFFTKRLNNCSYNYGDVPEWVSKHTMVHHQMAAAAETFELSTMIQWALDNNLTEEYEIAYGYAQLGNTDVNAAAFLKSNQQARYVKDCLHMVRLYRRYELKQMSMSQWIKKCCDECPKVGEWKVIAAFLRFQNINVVSFLTALRLFFKCLPKKNCLLFHGPPDTGKSYLAYSLITFLKGRVVSMMNRQSQFFLMPLQDCKIGFIDDCTYSAWQFIDINMRAALDGNYVSIDSKHKAPVQIKLPPLIVTSNHDVMGDLSLRYLHSRITSFNFPNKMPLDELGNPVYQINDDTWKSFFMKLALQLDLQFEEDDESGRFYCSLRESAGPDSESL